jgi:hypothetical protein
MKKVLLTALIAALLLAPFLFSGCNSQNPEQEGFAIYLTRDDIPVSQMPALSHVEIAETPLISAKDIKAYTWDTHEIELAAKSYDRLAELKVPTSGKSFVVCVDKQPVYWGAFWTPFSSQSFDGVTIWVLPFSKPGNTIQLELGYPSSGFYQGDDPRDSPEIMQSLEQAGKLK